jgi:hypothetical protein
LILKWSIGMIISWTFTSLVWSNTFWSDTI